MVAPVLPSRNLNPYPTRHDHAPRTKMESKGSTTRSEESEGPDGDSKTQRRGSQVKGLEVKAAPYVHPTYILLISFRGVFDFAKTGLTTFTTHNDTALNHFN